MNNLCIHIGHLHLSQRVNEDHDPVQSRLPFERAAVLQHREFAVQQQHWANKEGGRPRMTKGGWVFLNIRVVVTRGCPVQTVQTNPSLPRLHIRRRELRRTLYFFLVSRSVFVQPQPSR